MGVNVALVFDAFVRVWRAFRGRDMVGLGIVHLVGDAVESIKQSERLIRPMRRVALQLNTFYFAFEKCLKLEMEHER